MALPTKIPGAQNEIFVLHNIWRMNLQLQIIRALGNDAQNGVEVEIGQIDHHLSQAFEYADLVLQKLRQAGLDALADQWLRAWTGHILYPNLAASQQK